MLHILCVFVFISVSVKAEDSPQYHFKYSRDNDSNLINIPFQFGLEFGHSLRLKSKDDFISPGINGYVDFNLFEKIIYIRCELGKMLLYYNIQENGEDNPEWATYGSLGLNFRYLTVNRSKFYVSVDVFTLSIPNKSAFLPSLLVSLRYLYAINKYFGITTSVKYPLTYGNNLYVALGLQLFN